MRNLPKQCEAHGHHTLQGLRANLSADIHRSLTFAPDGKVRDDSFKRRLSAFLRPGLQSLLLHRISHYLYARGWRWLALVMSRLNLLMHKVNISPQSCIGPGCRLPHPVGLAFHGRAGRGVTLFAISICTTREGVMDGPVENGPWLGDRVLIGGESVVIGSVRVGNDTKVGYTVRLDRDAPDGVLVVSRHNRPIIRPRRDHQAAPDESRSCQADPGSACSGQE